MLSSITKRYIVMQKPFPSISAIQFKKNQNGSIIILDRILVPKDVVKILCRIQKERRLCQAQVGPSLLEKKKKKTVGSWRWPGIGEERDDRGINKRRKKNDD